MERAITKTVLAGVFVLTTMGSAVAGDSFPTWRGDSSLAGIVGTVPDDPIRRWQFLAGAPVSTVPVAGDGRIFIVNDRGNVFGLDLNGVRQWSRTFTQPSVDTNAPPVAMSFVSPLYAGKTLFLVSEIGDVLALDPADGGTRWKASTGHNVKGSPNFVKDIGKSGLGLVVLSQSEGILTCLDGADGSVIWTTGPFARADGTIAVLGDRIAFGACDATIHVLSATNGREVATVPLGANNEVAGGVALSGDRVFSGSRSGALHAIDIRRQTREWATDGDNGQLFTTPAVDSNLVVYGTGAGTLCAVTRTDGKGVWMFKTRGEVDSPLLAGKRVVATAGDTLFILDRDTGRQLWSQSSGDRVTPPAIIGGLLIIASDDGTVSAYGGKDIRP